MPEHAVPGGRLTIKGSGFDPDRAHALRLFFGDQRAQITRVSSDAIATIVPDRATSMLHVEIDDVKSEPFEASIATLMAEELQPVANPAVDAEGGIYVTLSGGRGEKVPVSLYRIEPDGEVKPFLSDILNPTGLAWGPNDCLYVSSRQDGTVYRVHPSRDVELVADELGIATGLAFNPEGILYVGDRRGTIFRIERNGEPRAFCQLEPSISAYHLAFNGNGDLFVTGPSLATHDPVYRIDSKGRVEVFCQGFGRPQGLAFDETGNLYVAEGLTGDSGIIRITPEKEVTRIISSPPLVGLAFDGTGGLVLAGNSSVFRLKIGILGQPSLRAAP